MSRKTSKKQLSRTTRRVRFDDNAPTAVMATQDFIDRGKATAQVIGEMLRAFLQRSTSRRR